MRAPAARAFIYKGENLLDGILTAAIIYFIYWVVNIAVFRLIAPSSPVRSMTLVFLVLAPLVHFIGPWVSTLGITEAVGHWLSPEVQIALVTPLIFSFLWYIWIQAYSVIEASITVKILVHFYQAKNQSLTPRDLQELYPFKDLLENRIGLMVRDGLILATGEPSNLIYTATIRGRRTGAAFAAIKDFLRWGQGG